MRFTRGEALPGETVLPIPNRKGRLLDRWGIGVSRREGLVRLEESILRPEVCAMICVCFRLPFNDKIRRRRIDLIRTTAYCPERDTLQTPRGKPVALSRLQLARLEVPEHVREIFGRFSVSENGIDISKFSR